MSTVNTGWLKDNNGEKFAPKTLSSQVITENGETLNSVLDNLDSGGYILKENPVGTGSLSLNRKADTTIGDCSSVLGRDCEASGRASHAEGEETKALGSDSHVEGYGNTASGHQSHAEGMSTSASGVASHAEGMSTSASGITSHAEGSGTIASSTSQHAQGEYNIEDAENVYAHIVGNGSSNTERSNAHTLDWDGNAWFAGDVYLGGTSQSNASKIADYIIEQGKSGSWYYRKWANGTYECWGKITSTITAVVKGFGGNANCTTCYGSVSFPTVFIEIPVVNYTIYGNSAYEFSGKSNIGTGSFIWYALSNATYTQGSTMSVYVDVKGRWK